MMSRLRTAAVRSPTDARDQKLHDAGTAPRARRGRGGQRAAHRLLRHRHRCGLARGRRRHRRDGGGVPDHRARTATRSTRPPATRSPTCTPSGRTPTRRPTATTSRSCRAGSSASTSRTWTRRTSPTASLARLAYSDLGGFAVATALSLPYSLAVPAPRGLATDGGDATRSAVCLTGWYGAQVFNGAFPDDVVISPGDLDEAVQFLLAYGVEDAVFPKTDASGFELLRSFRAGFLQGAGACDVGVCPGAGAAGHGGAPRGAGPGDAPPIRRPATARTRGRAP